MISLLSQPDQMDALRTQPELCANVADELLRHDGTVQLTSRYATADVTFGDVTIPAGDGIFVILGAANRDPEHYPNPDQIDFTRTKVQPLAFGGGVHLCLGAPLARLEIEIVFRKLVRAVRRRSSSATSCRRTATGSRCARPAPSRSSSDRGTPASKLAARPAGDDAAVARRIPPSARRARRRDQRR